MDTKNLATMTKEQFAAFLSTQKTSRSLGGECPRVGDKYKLCADGRELTVCRVEPGAKTCCYFIDAQGKVWYRNFTAAKAQTVRLTK